MTSTSPIQPITNRSFSEKMLLESGILSEFNKISGGGLGRLSGTPIRWSKKEKRFDLNLPCFKAGALTVFHYVASSFGHIAYGYFFGNDVEKSDPFFMLTLVHGCGFTSLFLFLLELCREPVNFLNFFEKLVQVELKNETGQFTVPPRNTSTDPLRKKARNLVKLAVLSCRLVRVSTLTPLPVLVTATALVAPEFPTNILCHYPARVLIDITKNLGDGWLGFGLEKLVTFTINMFAFSLTTKMWALLLIHIIIGCTGLTTAVMRFQSLFQKAIKESGSVSMSSNGTDADLGWALLYRQIHLLSKLFNLLEAKVLFVLCTSMVSCQIMFGFSVLKEKQGIFIDSINGICFVNAMIAVFFLLSFCALLFVTSVGCLDGMRSLAEVVMRHRGYRELWKYRRLIRSMPALRVGFGSNNFIDSLTPAIIQNFTMLRLIDCLLVSSS